MLEKSSNLSHFDKKKIKGCFIKSSKFTTILQNAFKYLFMEQKVLYWIFRASRTLKDGTVLYARNYGLKAWKIPVYKK
jgi:hypothetical protein